MKRYGVIFLSQANRGLAAIEDYIANESSSAIAGRFVDGILLRCMALDRFPERGTPRDDLREGLRTIVYRRRVTIAYMVDRETVVIVGFFYRGQDIEALLSEVN